jgi:enamine deaminase RidA (YjgF/YER057c/UK114 family)
MPIEFVNPPTVHSTGGRYAHGAVVTGGGRRLVISGQVGTRPDGTIIEDPAAQCTQVVANLKAILASQGMGMKNVVKITAFLTDPGLIPAWRAAREAGFEGHVSASTLLIVAGLADPRWKIEVEAEAAD